jgi:asparagine synthase (glutamine-hydrolysing)
MCGIVGQIGYLFGSEYRLQALKTLEHRGPDGSSDWISPSQRAWLGHRRLSIVDLSEAGSQPMHNEDKTIWLVCNGEIYNYPALRKRLEGLGHIFYSNCDSECIIHAFEQWGEACVDVLIGMFAFAIWDENQKKLMLARDRVGIKPLYYVENNNGLVFGSELHALYPLLENELPVNPLAIAYIFSMMYIPAPLTIRKGAFKLEAGHILSWNMEYGVKIRKYWEPPRYIDDRKKHNIAEWDCLFESVLEEHLLSDVPIGLFLSGGLDSASLALGLKRLDYPVEALTVGFPEDPNQDESSVAGMVAQKLGLSYTNIPIIKNDIAGLREKVAQIYDEPEGGKALMTMVQICEVAKRNKGYKVVLAGDGGDEVFGGYNWYRKLRLPVNSMREYLSTRKDTWMLRLRNDRMRVFFNRSDLHRHIRRISSSQFLPEDIEGLLRPMGVSFGEEEFLAPFEKHYVAGLPLRRRLQRVDLMTFCSDEVLFKVDRASMAYGLEVRVPFLDHRIIEYGLTFPVMEKEEQLVGKQVLRDYLQGHVPQEVLSHPKQGFSLRALVNYDWQKVKQEIDEGYWVRQGLISSAWQTLFEKTNSKVYLWELAALSDWAEKWLV